MRKEGEWTRRTLVALLLSCTSACQAPGDPGATSTVSDSAGIRIVDLPPARVSTPRSLEVDTTWLPEFEVEVGRLADVQPLPGGGALALDELGGTVSILAPTGRVLGQAGRLGGGPGEFSPHGGISRVVATDSSFFVPDIQLQRITEFSMDGEVLQVRPFPALGADPVPFHGVDWRAHPDGGMAFRVLSLDGEMLLRMRGQDIDTLHSFSVPIPQPNQILAATPFWDLDVEGRLILGRSDRASLEMRTPGEASPVWITRWNNTPRSVTTTERAHLEDLLIASAEAQGMDALPAAQRAAMLASVTLPDSVPLLAAVLIDPGGHIWVQEPAAITAMGPDALRVGSAAGFGGSEWQVLASDGLPVDRILVPEGFSPRRAADRCLFGILADDVGVERPARVCLDDTISR